MSCGSGYLDILVRFGSGSTITYYLLLLCQDNAYSKEQRLKRREEGEGGSAGVKQGSTVLRRLLQVCLHGEEDGGEEAKFGAGSEVDGGGANGGRSGIGGGEGRRDTEVGVEIEGGKEGAGLSPWSCRSPAVRGRRCASSGSLVGGLGHRRRCLGDAEELRVDVVRVDDQQRDQHRAEHAHVLERLLDRAAVGAAAQARRDARLGRSHRRPGRGSRRRHPRRRRRPGRRGGQDGIFITRIRVCRGAGYPKVLFTP